MTNLEFLKSEPQIYDKRLLDCGIKLETDEHIHWRLEKEKYDRFNSVPQEKRQEILSIFKKGGITIGEIAVKYGIDSMVVGDIIFLNLQNVYMLRGTSL
jgi:hypothetical protein